MAKVISSYTGRVATSSQPGDLIEQVSPAVVPAHELVTTGRTVVHLQDRFVLWLTNAFERHLGARGLGNSELVTVLRIASRASTQTGREVEECRTTAELG